MYDEIEEKKLKVDKILKKKKHLCLMDMLFKDQDNYAFYVRLDYDKKIYAYKVIWVNLTQMDIKKAEGWINSNLIYPHEVDRIKELFVKNGITEDYIDRDRINSKCVINSYITNYECNRKTFEFKRYIPKCWNFLADVLFTIFNSIPKNKNEIFQILIEDLVKPEVNKVFVYDEEKEKLEDLFEQKIIDIGLGLQKIGAVTFIEQKGDATYATVHVIDNYLVSIYDMKSTKEMQLSCTCGANHFCEHMYAALTAKNKGEEKKFFKIAKIDSDKNILDNINNFEYFLCPGIFQGTFVVILADSFQLLPILVNNKLQYKIIEDNKDKDLEKALKEYLDSVGYKEEN